MYDQPLRIGIVAGEASGDLLGAGLLSAINQQCPNLIIEGIGGPQMIAAGCDSQFPMEELAVMGLVEVIGRLPRLLSIRKQLFEYFIDNPPDVFIGIDAPDFNLDLEKRLKQHGIKTVHYVSPSVWAWRENRIKKIKQAVDVMLCLLPFELDIYQRYQIDVHFVGHTLADQIPEQIDRQLARQELGLTTDQKILALMPGSRSSEIKRLTAPFLQAAELMKHRFPQLQIVIPLVNEQRKRQFIAIQQQVAPDLTVQLVIGQARTVLAACDVVILSSGTATLEAALIKRPMIVAYKFSWLSHKIIRSLLKVSHFSLPNLILGKSLVPELEQQQVTAEQLAKLASEHLLEPQLWLEAEFQTIHQLLKKDASATAAAVVLQLVGYRQ